MQHGGVRAVFSEVIGGAIVEAHADGEDHVGMVHGFVGFIGAVHAEHADALAMGAGKAPNPIRLLVTGRFSCSANANSSASQPALIAPPPTYITGFWPPEWFVTHV